MSRRTDDDLLAKAVLHLCSAIETARTGPQETVDFELHEARKSAAVVLNRGKSQHDPDYVVPNQEIVPPHGGMGADE